MLDLLKDLWDFLKIRKKFWLAPIILVLLLLGGLIVLSQGSAVAPFIYTLFEATCKSRPIPSFPRRRESSCSHASWVMSLDSRLRGNDIF